MKVNAHTTSGEAPVPGRIIDSIMEAEALLRDAEVTDTPRLEAEILLANVLGIGRAKLMASYGSTLGDSERTEYFPLVMRRARGEPIAYITGEKEFMGFSFRVDGRALIPRPETETLVEQVVETVRANECGGGTILDVGTGCGCIAISLALLIPDAFLHATDISSGAVELSRYNAERHGVDDRVTFHVGNLYSALPEAPKNSFNLIVSNPPYVSDAESAALDKTVKAFEPHVALRGGEDGLDVYRALVAGAADYLARNGWLAVEIGERQADRAAEIIERTDGFVVARLVRDLTGRQRVIMGLKTK
jgi:release factor glutamine methyltransferase